MSFIVNVYPYPQEAREAFDKDWRYLRDIMPKGAYKAYPTNLILDQFNRKRMYFGGINYRRLMGLRPTKFVVHDKDKCYGKVIEIINERFILHGVEVEYK